MNNEKKKAIFEHCEGMNKMKIDCTVWTIAELVYDVFYHHEPKIANRG